MGFQQRRSQPAQISAASPDVTLSLTGVVATAAIGTLAVAFSVGVTGNASTAAVGTLAPAFNVAVTGNASTSAVGTLAPSFGLTLTGNASTASVGTLAPSFGLAVTGNSSATGVGTLAVSFNRAITGNASTSAVGTVGSTFGLGITGNAATTAVGTTGVSFGVGTTGSQAGSSTGAFLEGVTATGALGTLGVKFDVATTGNASTTAVGTVGVKFDRAITGNTGTGNVGTTGVTFGVAITGNSSTTATGTVSPSSAGNIAISGVSSATATGNAGPAFGLGSTGAQSGCSVGSAGNTHACGFTGDVGTGIIGTVHVQGASNDLTLPVIGVQSVCSVGTCVMDVAVKLRAQFATPADISLTPTYQPSGQVTTYGNLGPYAQQVILDGATNYWRLDDAVDTFQIIDFVGGTRATVTGNSGLQVNGLIGDGNTARNVLYAGPFFNILPNPPGLIVDASVQTFEGWIYPRSLNVEAILFGDTVFGMSLGLGTNMLAFFQGVTTTLFGVTPIRLGVAHHLVLVKDLTSRRLYLDGVLEASDAFVDDWIPSPAGPGPGTRFQFCRRRSSTNPDATMDEIAFYRGVALTDQQIANHYALAPRKMPSVIPGVAFPSNDYLTSQTVQQSAFTQFSGQSVFTETFEG